jgi:hypothetical protein
VQCVDEGALGVGRVLAEFFGERQFYTVSSGVSGQTGHEVCRTIHQSFSNISVTTGRFDRITGQEPSDNDPNEKTILTL